MAVVSQMAWNEESSLAGVVRQQSDENLRVYATSAARVDEDAGQEMNLAHGGYGKRQLLELVQNGADAMISSPGGRIEIVLTADHLYCANKGNAIDEHGITALLHAHISGKRGAEIGRFGLGFKSVLGVTDKPEFYSRPVSFGFDAEWARDQISPVAPYRERYPALRLARILDLNKAVEHDPILAKLMAFATTVVRLPRNIGTSQWLHDDIAGFDPAFMLFSPHVGNLILSDSTTGIHREIRLHTQGEEVTVSEGADARRWRVFKSRIRPSAEAKREAWELSGRDELPIAWAVPMEGRLAVGRFWAFFNLRDETTVTGIANAPWQVNDDRVGLLEGSQLNRELLDNLSELVLASIPKLIKKDDPGWILDIMPARGREARCWGDDYLTARFHELAVHHALIPDQNANLLPADSLKLPPAEASRHALEVWAESPGRPSGWCHPTAVATTTRRSRVERLFEGIGKGPESTLTWLEALVNVDDISVDHAAHAILTAAAFIRPDDPDWETRRRAIHRSRILLDSTGRLTEADPTSIFIPRDAGAGSSLVRLILPELVAPDDVRRALAVIGINDVTPTLELKAFIRK